MEFDGKVVIITGSSSGIGQDCALLFASDGALITIHGQSDERIKETEMLLREAGISENHWLVVSGSIQNELIQRKLINATLQKFGRIDVLVNNAGLSHQSDQHPDSFESLEYVLDVNLKSLIKLTKLAIPQLIKTKGNVVNISSIYGQRGTADLSYYAVTKAAVNQFTKNSAIAYGPLGVRVNTVSPGAIETNFASRHGGDLSQADAAYKLFVDRTVVLGRKGSPREVSNCIWFLASGRASYVTGANYVVDGGSLSGQF